MSYRLLYFASLRDAAGIAEELYAGACTDLRSLYAELCAKYGFSLPAARLRVAVNGEFAAWDRHLNAGDEIVFLPPVSGG